LKIQALEEVKEELTKTFVTQDIAIEQRSRQHSIDKRQSLHSIDAEIDQIKKEQRGRQMAKLHKDVSKILEQTV
jgi:hypothetical protein